MPVPAARWSLGLCYPPSAIVQWLYGYQGDIAVAADGTVAPLPGVDVLIGGDCRVLHLAVAVRS